MTSAPLHLCTPIVHHRHRSEFARFLQRHDNRQIWRHAVMTAPAISSYEPECVRGALSPLLACILARTGVEDAGTIRHSSSIVSASTSHLPLRFSLPRVRHDIHAGQLTRPSALLERITAQEIDDISKGGMYRAMHKSRTVFAVLLLPQVPPDIKHHAILYSSYRRTCSC
jgi:hypothetical protein